MLPCPVLSSCGATLPERGLIRKESINNVINIARHQLRQVMPGFLQTMVGDTVLEIVIGANLLRPVAGAYLRLAHCGMLLRLLLFVQELKLRDENLHRLLAVRKLTALGRRAHVNAGWLVDKTKRRFNLV